MHRLRATTTALTAAALALGGAVAAGPASAAGAEVLYPPVCGWTADTFPGVDQEVLATYCKVVLTPSGGFSAVLRGRLPDGTSVDRTYVERGRGCILVATRSGRIVNVIGRC
jgi:hypothetical protein